MTVEELKALFGINISFALVELKKQWHAWNSADYDKLYKIHPVLNMVQDSLAESNKPGQNHTIYESMIAFKGRLSYVQYLPAKPINRGIKVWMHCDADTAYLHQFGVYLGWHMDMMWWWSFVRIYWENIIMSIVTCIHLFSYWRTCWLVKHTAMGQYEWIRSIFQRVFINLVEWSVVLTNHTSMVAQTWWPLFGKTIEF